MTSSNPGTTRPRQEPSSGTLKKAFLNQIKDRNFLAPTGFQFSVTRSPKVSYFGNMINVPGITLGVANQSSYLKMIPRPGEIIDFEDLTLNFLVDENLENYIEIQNWIRGIGFPETLDQIYDFQDDEDPTTGVKRKKNQEIDLFSDGTLTVMNNLNIPKFHVKFEGLFPYSLSSLQFDATQADLDYFTAQVSFKYNIYNIETIE